MLEKINKVTVKVASVLMGVAGIPQVLDIWRTKDSTGINPTFIGMIVLGLAGFILNGYVVYKETGDKRTMRSQYPNFLIMLVLFISITIFK